MLITLKELSLRVQICVNKYRKTKFDRESVFQNFFIIGKSDIYLVSLEPMTIPSILLLSKDEVSFELELIGSISELTIVSSKV